MQAVAREQPVRAQAAVDGHAGDVLFHYAHPGRHRLHAHLSGPSRHLPVQTRATDASPEPGTEAVLHGEPATEVPDTAEVPPRGFDADAGQQPESAGHQPLSAGLVDGTGPRLAEQHRQTDEASLDGSGQAHRAASDHEEVRVDHDTVASARSSTGMRTARTAALASVNTRAVTHAVWTRGSATTSTTTAT